MGYIQRFEHPIRSTPIHFHTHAHIKKAFGTFIWLHCPREKGKNSWVDGWKLQPTIGRW